MARSVANRRDLSKGWNDLYKLWSLSFEEKVAHSETIIKEALQGCSKPVVCWSGGKDSTVLLHLVRRFFKNIDVIYVKTGVEFEESLDYVDREWARLDLNLTMNAEADDFWEIGRRYGWPIFGKSIALSVSRAISTGNFRSAMSPFEKALAEEGVHISSRCAEILTERKSKEIEEDLGIDLKFVGFRAVESRLRTRLWVDYGEHYYVKRYFGRRRGIWKCSPIAIWTDDDVNTFFYKHGINKCELYDMGYPRNGCWPCAMAIKGGQLTRLKSYHPKLYTKLIEETEMGAELLRIKKIFMKPHYRKIINSAYGILADI